MRLQFELEISQNPALGAMALWQFSRAYFDTAGKTEGPTLPLTLIVLPMVFHRRTTAAIFRMKSASGIWKALGDHPEIPAGLQARVESSLDLTLDSLDIALASCLLDVDRANPWPRYTPIRKSLPRELSIAPADVKQILAAAQRLGWWLVDLSLIHI